MILDIDIAVEAFSAFLFAAFLLGFGIAFIVLAVLDPKA